MLFNTDQGKNPKESKNPENGRKSSPWGKKPNHALPKSTTAMKFSMVHWCIGGKLKAFQSISVESEYRKSRDDNGRLENGHCA